MSTSTAAAKQLLDAAEANVSRCEIANIAAAFKANKAFDFWYSARATAEYATNDDVKKAIDQEGAATRKEIAATEALDQATAAKRAAAAALDQAIADEEGRSQKIDSQ
jgi:hypothetical protein